MSAAALGLMLVVAACTQPPGTIIREKTMPNNGQLDLTDSRVRAITTQRPDISTRPGAVVPSTITCVEPHPSVALALANGLGAGVSILQGGSGALSSSVAENVFQTDERTIAVQALLNAGYQNCLDYANGAITGTFYAIRASNLDNLLVTMTLASESAGNLRSNLGSASTTANANAEASLISLGGALGDIQDKAKALGDARRKTAAAQEDLAKKKQALADATTARQKAEDDEKTAAAAGKAGDDLKAFTDATAKAKTTEASAQQDVTKAQDNVTAAEREQSDIEAALMDKVDATTASSAGGKDVKGAGGPSNRPTDTAVITIGEMQRRFLDRQSSGQYITACLVELGLGTTGSPAGASPLAKDGQLANGKPPSAGSSFERDFWSDLKPYLAGRLKGQAGGGLDNNDVGLFNMLARSERDSQLADFCGGHLQQIVQTAQQNEQQLALQRGQTENVAAIGQTLAMVVALGKQCDETTGKDDKETSSLRQACRQRLNTMTALIERMAAPPVPVPLPPVPVN
jgi:hypothetical protein